MMLRSRLKQGQAFAVLLVRQWLRAGMPGARIERFRKGSAFVVRLVAVVLYLGIGRALGDRSLQGAASGIASVEWLLAGLLAFDACWGMLTRARALRGMALPLGSPLLDTLPTHDAVRTAVELMEVALAHGVTAVAFATAAPALPTAVALALGAAASVAATAVGAALMRWLFVLVTPERAASIARAAAVVQGFCLALALAGPSASWKIRPPFLSSLARPLAGEGGLVEAFGFTAVVFGAAVAALLVAERIGYDRSDVVPQKRPARASLNQLSISHIDELLSRREPGGGRWAIVVFGGLSLLGLGAVIVDRGGDFSSESGDFLPTLFVGFTGWMAVSLAASLATRAVARDLVARPLLSALPIEPRQLIDGKISLVRRRLALGLAPLLFALVSPLSGGQWRQLAWRGAAVSAGAWMYGSAAVCVAFLTGGTQNARPQPGGTVRLESLLLLGPLTALLAAQSPWTTLVPLVGLWLLGFEAKRAAMRVARWLDDGEDFERETPAWRAALAFAAFQGSQVLVSRVLSGWGTDDGVVMGGSYVASALFLAALVAYGRRDLAPLRIWPKNPLGVAVGLAAGIGTAAFARFVVLRLFATEMRSLDVHFDSAGQLVFGLATATVAPVVEELFFRGWLQHVIARDLAGNRRWLAPVIAALAFASVHPPASFFAVFPLGLVAGVLYSRTRSLAPSVVAHAAHNWGVMLMS